MIGEGLLAAGPSARVGIVLLTGIGDVVHGLPLANDLKRDDPAREVVWIAEPAPSEVLRHHPSVDHVIVFRKGDGWAGLRALRRDLRGLRCDLTLNLMRYAKSLAPTLLTRARVRVGLARSQTRDGVHLLAHHRPVDRGWAHTQDLFLGMRSLLGLPTDGPVEWGITFSPEEREVAARELAELREAAGDRPLVGVVLATANAAKDWPEARSLELCRALLEEGQLPVLIGGPSGKETRLGARIVSALPEVRSTLGDSVRRMMWTVEGVHLLVSPDTGPLHLAHALGTPVVGLFGHTNPARVGPWRDSRHLVVDRYTEPEAGPDPAGYLPKEGRMERIEVEDVVEKVREGLRC